MIIELFGLPGSGKTSLARTLAQEPGFEVIKIRSKKELVFYNLVFFVRNPFRFLRLLGWVLGNIGHRKLFYLKIMNAFFNDNAKYEKARRYSRAILDQGYFQNVLSLFEGELDKEKLKDYIKIIPKPDWLFILDLPPEERERRIKERGFFSREKMDEKYLEGWRKVLSRNYQLFFDILPDLSIKYVVLDGGETSEILANEIKRTVL